MFCPKCGYEYRAGITRCPDCDVELVERPPVPPENADVEYVEYVELLETYNPADIALIKSILDGEGITYYFHGEHFMYVRPLAEPARLMVDTEEADRAEELLEDLDLNILGPHQGGTGEDED